MGRKQMGTCNVASIANRLTAVESSLGTNEPLLGCSEEEIQSLESCLKITLPECYKEFLLRMGHHAGRLFRGIDGRYSRLLDLQQEARELIQEVSSPFELPPDAFVFAMSQGCNMWFFHTAARSSDPPVYFWQFDFEHARRSFLSFSDYLLDCVELIESNVAREMGK